MGKYASPLGSQSHNPLCSPHATTCHRHLKSSQHQNLEECHLHIEQSKYNKRWVLYIFTRLCPQFTDSALLWVRCCQSLVSSHLVPFFFHPPYCCAYILSPNLRLPSFLSLLPCIDFCFLSPFLSLLSSFFCFPFLLGLFLFLFLFSFFL